MNPKKKPQVYAVGETVFDIIFKDYQPQAGRPGGSAFNTMISLGRLGIPGHFISEVGNDRIGHYTREYLAGNNIRNEYVEIYDDGKSALALAFLDENSDAEYDFYKDYPKQRLEKKIPDFTSSDYLLFGSFYGLNPTLRPRIEQLLEEANTKGTLIFYDPNFRSSHLDDLEELRETIEENFRATSIVRASDEDLKNIFAVSDFKKAKEKVMSFCDYFIYTANSHGIDLATPKFDLHIEVEQIEPISTIGAGDTFNAGIIYAFYRYAVTRQSLSSLGRQEWTQILQTAAMFSKEVCLSYDNYLSTEFAASFIQDQNSD